MTPASTDPQFTLSQKEYLAGVDFFTWTRHYHLIKDLCRLVDGDVFEVGTGDGVVRRCLLPFVHSYTVMDLNAWLQPDIHGDLLEYRPTLAGRFDAAIASEVLEHLPFDRLPRCVAHLHAYLRPGGRLFVTVPHRKGHMLVVTPRQRLWTWRFPFGTTSLGEAWNRWVRRRIWIDPNHYWEIGDGRVSRADVERVFTDRDLQIEGLTPLPYCDYWVLRRPSA